MLFMMQIFYYHGFSTREGAFRILRSQLVKALFVLVLMWSASDVRGAVPGVQCPSGIDANDCVANDLQPTGSSVIEGPTACTEGEVFSAKVRIEFGNGGGANARYTVGFYVGETGELAIGGSSCTFDSMQPVGEPINLTGGSGGFLELNGDACGDVSKSDPTYKDISLDSVLCKDDDGDGNVDISYILTWENNANQANCQDPLDPGAFIPNPPKCLSDLEADLPIMVEPPPSIDVNKIAYPSTLNAPGGDVDYLISIVNTSPAVSDPVTISAIIDIPYGDISDQTNCVLPIILAPSQKVDCLFETQVSGQAGEQVLDTVTVFGEDDEGEPVEDSDSATVEILEEVTPTPPGDLRLAKFASPRSVDEPGGRVKYDVLVANLSETAVELTGLEDDIYGDLDGKGTCSVPQILVGASTFYSCTFEEEVSGFPGDVITDTITATGLDASQAQNLLDASDSASVTILNLSSDIEITKVANPQAVVEPGGLVDYTLQIQNHSAVDQVTITSLVDSLLGSPAGDCAVPFTLNAGGDLYTCTYPGLVSGNAGDAVTNEVVATGIDDDGFPVTDATAETVIIVGADPSIEVAKYALPPLALVTGSQVAYLVVVHNTSSATDPVTITSLVDDIYGDLDGRGSCDLNLPEGIVLQPAPGADSYYMCSWIESNVSGPEGTVLTDIVTASGNDDENTPVSASDDASVLFIDAPANPGVPKMELAKIASPVEIPEPGGDVTFTILIVNASDPAEQDTELTVTGLTDDIYGDLNGKGDCALPITLPVGSAALCSFTENVSGPVNSEITNVVTATASYGESGIIEESDDATVTILDIPSSLSLTKTAYPSTVKEPGAEVTFNVMVANTSKVDQVTVNSLMDSIHGDLDGSGDCALPRVMQPGGIYGCEFTAFVGGQGGGEEQNLLVASGVDDDGLAVSALDIATVAILDLPPSVVARKTADPVVVPEEGGLVSFAFTASNTSTTDTVVLNTINDSVFGDLNGQGDCSVPQVLEPGQSYSCQFQAFVAGSSGDSHVDEIVVTGVSDDGDPVSAHDNAVVRFVALIPVPTLNQVGLVVLLLLLVLGGTLVVRQRL